jgi:hypothetical protein
MLFPFHELRTLGLVVGVGSRMQDMRDSYMQRGYGDYIHATFEIDRF